MLLWCEYSSPATNTDVLGGIANSTNTDVLGRHLYKHWCTCTRRCQYSTNTDVLGGADSSIHYQLETLTYLGGISTITDVLGGTTNSTNTDVLGGADSSIHYQLQTLTYLGGISTNTGTTNSTNTDVLGCAAAGNFVTEFITLGLQSLAATFRCRKVFLQLQQLSFQALTALVLLSRCGHCLLTTCYGRVNLMLEIFHLSLHTVPQYQQMKQRQQITSTTASSQTVNQQIRHTHAYCALINELIH